MEHSLSSILLGQLSPTVPTPGGFIALYKPIIVLVVLFGWLFLTQWAYKDIEYVKTRIYRWHLTVFSGGAVGLLAWLFFPFRGVLFWFGLLLFLFLSLGAILTYVLHRNSLVAKSARILTPRHIRGMVVRVTGKGDAHVEAIERIRINNWEGRHVKVPADDEEREQFMAMQNLLSDALWRRSSEVDLIAAGDRSQLGYRIDGVPTPRTDLLKPDEMAQALTMLKKVAGLNVEEKRKPQRGKMSALYPLGTNNRVQMEVRSSGSTHGERVQIRIAADLDSLRLPDLGIAPPRLELFKKVVEMRAGLVLFGGTPNSGVTTTQYATARSHDAFMSNIHALERRQLMELENITQHVHDSQNPDLGFARQLQSILRREPDVVIVDDCPDHETAELAARAASAGRKIYLSVRGRDCLNALNNYLNFLEDNKLAASVLLAVTNQRLVRKLCPECREAYTPDENLLRKANLPADKIEHFYRTPVEVRTDRRGNPVLCKHCQGTGYYGRTGLFEIMIINDDIRKLIRAGAKMSEIKQAARKNKMLYLQEEGLIKVIDSVTSMDEVLRALRNDNRR
ncbi:MAG: Flp pilus assembly complex ATPase component TadA [Phycisphaerales bacterium]|nr:MAG: Flp pilus assembly complex ATPase component TadA [Phycisphaerales bacterium]